MKECGEYTWMPDEEHQNLVDIIKDVPDKNAHRIKLVIDQIADAIAVNAYEQGYIDAMEEEKDSICDQIIVQAQAYKKQHVEKVEL